MGRGHQLDGYNECQCSAAKKEKPWLQPPPHGQLLREQKPGSIPLLTLLSGGNNRSVISCHFPVSLQNNAKSCTYCYCTNGRVPASNSLKVAVQVCNHEITRYFKAYLIQTRRTDGSKLYIK